MYALVLRSELLAASSETCLPNSEEIVQGEKIEGRLNITL